MHKKKFIIYGDKKWCEVPVVEENTFQLFITNS